MRRILPIVEGEFESLFLADEQTTRALFTDIPPEVALPVNPKSVRDAKGWLSQARPKDDAYKPTQHQARPTARLNLATLRDRSATFQRFEAAVTSLLAVRPS